MEMALNDILLTFPKNMLNIPSKLISFDRKIKSLIRGKNLKPPFFWLLVLYISLVYLEHTLLNF